MLRTLSRWLLVATQCTTLGMTWPLWLSRTDLPAVRRVACPDLDAGPVILASLALVLLPDLIWLLRRRPAPSWLAPLGMLSHLLVLALAMVQDELRVQPQVIVPALMLFATLPRVGARCFGLGLLSTLWIWAGLHKLISDRYVELFGERVVARLFPSLSQSGVTGVCLAVAWAEFLLGVALLLAPFARRPVLRWSLVLSALGLHVGIVAALATLEHNITVWPWNLALAGVAVWLLATARHSLPSELRRSGWLPRGAVAAILIVPAGFYWGISHPYLSFVLYSCNAPRAHVELPSGEIVPLRYIKRFESFIPPTHFNFRSLFLQNCQSGHRLVILDSRSWARRTGRDRVVVPCPRSHRW